MDVPEAKRKLRKLAAGIKALGDLRAHYHELNRLQADVRQLQIHLEQVQQGVQRVVQEGVQQVEKGKAERLEGISRLLRGEMVGLDPEALVEKVAERVPRFRFLQESYSQEGEDLVLARIFEGKTTGFYVDVGAHHPLRFSNTYLFYRRGWRGINIDATPGSMQEFRRMRPHDINIEALISSDHGSASFFLFNEPALNTGSAKLAYQRPSENASYQVVDKVVLETRSLSEILDAHLPNGQKIDFLNVDAEGADLSVLKSNNWDRYQPTYILAELLDTEFKSVKDHKIALYLQRQGYYPSAKFVHTTLFVKQPP
jgi:FkbM family methyltransferase